MHREQVAPERGDYALVRVQHHVQAERHAGRGGDGPDVVVDGIAGVAPGGSRIPDAGRIV